MTIGAAPKKGGLGTVWILPLTGFIADALENSYIKNKQALNRHVRLRIRTFFFPVHIASRGGRRHATRI